MFKNIEKFIPDKRKSTFISHIYVHQSTTSTVFAMLGSLLLKNFWGEYNAKIYG